MMSQNQNSAGFLKTEAVSIESLIENVPNFDFNEEAVTLFSDEKMKIPERLMLGKRAERYFSEWVKQSSGYELIEENIQIIHEKQTLGEFDFVIRRIADKQLIHIELVYKFYLFDPSASSVEFQRWIGPNKGDRLDLKLDKLSKHQFPLLHSDPAKSRLSDLGISTSEIEQQVLFLVNLFVPKGQLAPFEKVNKNAVEGSWMNLTEWGVSSSGSSRFAIPEKKDWFSRSMKTEDWLKKEEALEVIKGLHDRKRSPLVWSKDSEGNQERDFVVWW